MFQWFKFLKQVNCYYQYPKYITEDTYSVKNIFYSLTINYFINLKYVYCEFINSLINTHN